MTPKEQRLAIAKACGWAYHNIHPRYGKQSVKSWYYRDSDTTVSHKSSLPDYLNDLNAVHHFENYVKQDDPHAYACYASDLFEKYGSDAVSLPASTRAEELLKTIGKWIY